MKYTRTFLVSTASFTAMACAEQAATRAAEVELKRHSIDVGEVMQSTGGEFELSFNGS